MTQQKLTNGQDLFVSEVENEIDEGVFEVELFYPATGITTTAMVSELSEEDSESEDVLYFEFSVRTAVELCVFDVEDSMGFKVTAVHGVSRAEILDA